MIEILKGIELLEKDLPQNPVWIGPDVLPKSCKMMIGAQAKAGKSLIMLELCRALMLGEVPFGCPLFTMPSPASLLLIEHELKVYGVQKRIKKTLADLSEGQKKEAMERFFIVSGQNKIKFSNAEGRMSVSEAIRVLKPDILMLDPISKMHNFPENDNTEIGKMFDYLDGLVEDGSKWGMSIIMSHHFGKPVVPFNGQQGRDPLDPYSFRGSSKFYDELDVLMTNDKVGSIITPDGHKAWRLKSRFITRHDGQLPDFLFHVNENNDLRVHFAGTSDSPVLPPAAGRPADTTPQDINNDGCTSVKSGGIKIYG